MPILKTIGSLLGPFWADLQESLSVYPKSGKNSLNFPTVLVPSIIILQLFFFISKWRFKSILSDEFLNLAKKNLGGAVQGVQFFLVILEWPSLGLNSKKHPTSDFHENWSKYRKKSNLEIMFLVIFTFWVFVGQKAENVKKDKIS